MPSERERAADARRLDRASVRRAFERAAATYDNAAVLQREVGQRMAERLGIVRLEPSVILDAGCGTGDALGELHARYPGAFLLGLDLAFNMARAARDRVSASGVERSILQRVLGSLRSHSANPPRLLCADLAQLPVAAGVVDLLWSNLALQWVDDLPAALAEFRRAMKVGGLLSFTTFGPDTLRELRTAFAAADGGTHVNRFIDMHDVGDMLVDAGFADPVIDMEMISVTYTEATALMRELKAIGAHNANIDRQRGLTGRQRWRRMLDSLEAFRRDGRLPATYEIIYAHAWKPAPRLTSDGRAIVHFERHRDPGAR